MSAEAVTAREIRVADSFLTKVPVVAVQPHELMRMRLNHRAGFLLSLMDGETSVDSVIDLSGMASDDVLVLLDDLLVLGAVVLR